MLYHLLYPLHVHAGLHGLNVLRSMSEYWLWSKGLLEVPKFDIGR